MLLVISTLIVQAHQKSLFRQMDSVRHMKTSSNVRIPHLAKKELKNTKSPTIWYSILIKQL